MASLLFTFPLFWGLCHGIGLIEDPFTDVATAVPACGLRCVLDLTPGINTTCLAVDSTTMCLCEGDIEHYTEVLSCVQAQCTVEESIETARGAWRACGEPRRSRKPDLLATLSIEIPALLCVLLRFFSRWWTTCRFETDDYIMMVVALCYLVFEILGTASAYMAFGVDIWVVSSANLTISIKFFYIAETFYLSIITLTKISILCFYLRIFPNYRFRIACFAVMAWVAVSGVVFIFLQIFQCTPVAYLWDGWKKGAFGPFRCSDLNTLAFTSAAFSIGQDMVILILPLPLLARLDVSRRSKLGIMFMFSLGIFVLITSCVRLWTIMSFGDSVNPTWDYTNALIWTGLEVAVSIIVTSLPAIRVLLCHCFPGAFGSPRGSRRLPGRGYTSTSSFGNDTYIASWHSAPPALKRISGVSRISFIIDGWSISDCDGETHTELDDKMRSVVEQRYSCPATLRSENVKGVNSPRKTPSPMPNIGDVLSAGGYAEPVCLEREAHHARRAQTPRSVRTATMTSQSTTVVASDSPGSDRSSCLR